MDLAVGFNFERLRSPVATEACSVNDRGAQTATAVLASDI